MRKRIGFCRGRRVTGIGLVLVAVMTGGASAQETESGAEADRGRVTFREYCRSCHGTEARGDGPVAEYLSPQPADLTKIAQRNQGEFPFDKVYKAIAGGRNVKGHGSSEMPVWGKAFQRVRGGESEEQVKVRITNLVHYLRSIQEQ